MQYTDLDGGNKKHEASDLLWLQNHIPQFTHTRLIEFKDIKKARPVSYYDSRMKERQDFMQPLYSDILDQ
ncbi:hypothetical protein ACNR90_004934 [Candidozyma auris]